MLKSTYRDLTTIIILSIASLAFLTVPALDQFPLNIVPQFLILLFLPGYALIALIDPLFNQRSTFRRVFWSIGLSLLLTVITVYAVGVVSSLTILVGLAVLLSIITFYRRKYRKPHPLTQEEVSRKVEEDERVAPVMKTGMESSIKEPEKAMITEEPEKPAPIKKPKKTILKGSFFSLDLLLVIILTVLCALFVLEPTLNKTAVRTVLGLLLVLFLPGYALIASLFPKKDDLDTIERLALSFGLSIAITPLIGLALNYTPFGIRLDPILIPLTGFTLLMCFVAYLRRRRIPDEELFHVDFSGFYRGVRESFQGESKTGKILSVILILSIILAITTTAYIIVNPKEGESFTEFYILGPDGKASNYPTNLTPDQTGNLIIGVVNHENRETSYRLLVTSNNTLLTEQTLTLQNEEKMEIPFNFTAGDPGERKLEFLLYKLPDNNNVYRSLHLWLNVTGFSNKTVE